MTEDVEHKKNTSTNTIMRNNATSKRVSRAVGKKYACKQCDKQFTCLSGLRRHIQSIHEGVKYACNQCDYQATQQSSLTTHIQSKHECVKYACNQCD